MLKEKPKSIELWCSVAGVIGVLFGFYAYASAFTLVLQTKIGSISCVFGETEASKAGAASCGPQSRVSGDRLFQPTSNALARSEAPASLPI